MSITAPADLPPKCGRVRAEISKRRFNEGLILEAYRDRKEGCRHGGVKDHLVECESCLTWLGHQVEERFYLRAVRAAEYCCLSMYIAVEETIPGTEFLTVRKERVRFSLWRGEDPMWTIGAQGCTIYHCPWCGRRLPSQPFIPRNSDLFSIGPSCTTNDAQPLRQPERLQAALAGSLRPSAPDGRLRRSLGAKDGEVVMQKHVGIFAGWYLGFSTAAMLLEYFLDFGGTSGGIAALVASSFMAGSTFGKKHNRAPSPEEKSAFAWGALVVSALFMLVSIPVVLAFGLTEAEQKSLLLVAHSPTFMAIMVATVFVLGAVNFWVARWSFGWFAGKQVR